MDIWGILEIKETKNEIEIRQAYRKKIVRVNPEDDAEGFMRLRKAYEQALQYAKEPVITKESGQAKEENSTLETDPWICSLKETYNNIKKRLDIEAWKEIFHNDYCIGIDTSIEARNKLLSFLMDHYLLPNDVWKLIDKVFHIRDEIDELEELFPKDFLNYVVERIGNGSFLDYNLFRIEDENVDLDQYINIFFQLYNKLEQNDIESCEEDFSKLDEFAIFHPYYLSLKIRYLIKKQELDTAEKEAEGLFKEYPIDYYIRYIYASVKSLQGKYEDAYVVLEKLIEELPNYYYANVEYVKCLIKMKEYKRAKEITLELYDKYTHNELLELLNEINDILIQQYEEKDKGKELKEDERIELAWCLYQNDRYEDARRNLDMISTEKQNTYDFINLNGRVDLALARYDTALDKCVCLLGRLLELKRNLGDEEFHKEYHSLGFAYYAIGLCLTELGQFEEALGYFKDSAENEKKYRNQLQARIMIADTYYKLANYEECITTCEKIINEEKGYYPAYIYSIKASYKIGLDQDVVNLYNEAIRIYAEDYTPYLYAIKVFMRHNQYEDAKKILDVLKNKKITNPDIEMERIKLIRFTSNDQKELEKTLDACIKLKESIKEIDKEYKNKTEVFYELSVLYWKVNQLSNALQAIEEGIKLNPSNVEFVRLKGYIYKELGEYKKAYKLFCQIYDNDENNYVDLYEIAEYEKKVGKYNTALKKYHLVNERAKGYKDVFERISDIYLEKYKDEKKAEYINMAIEFANQMIAQNERCYTLVNRGLIYITACEYDKALEDFYKALEYHESDSVVLNDIGYVQKIQRKMDEAIESLRKSTELVTAKEYCLPFGNLADSYQIVGKYDEAIELYKILINYFPKEKVYYMDISNAYKMQGKYLESIQYQKEILKITNRKTVPYREIGLLHYLLGAKLKANFYFVKAILSSRYDIYTHYAYAEFLLANKKYLTAVKVISRLSKVYYAEHTMIEICEMIADVLKEASWGQKQKGIKKWEKNLEKSHFWAKKALDYIHKVYEKEEDYYSFKPSARKKLISLSCIYLYMGNDTMALNLMKQALQCSMCEECVHAECDLAYKVLGLIMEEQGKLLEAYENYEKCLKINPTDISIKKHYEYTKNALKEL